MEGKVVAMSGQEKRTSGLAMGEPLDAEVDGETYMSVELKLN